MPRNGDVNHYTGVFRLAGAATASPSRPGGPAASSSTTAMNAGTGTVSSSGITATAADPTRKVIKRNRQVVSCKPCRTRKLKCDRQQPCGSCVKRQDENSCRFFAGGNGHDGGAGAQGAREGQEGGGRMMMHGVGKRAAQARLQMLERVVSELRVQKAQDNSNDEGVGQEDATMTATPSPPPREDLELRKASDSQRQQPSDGGHLARQGSQVRFIGATTYEAVLECIRDLQGFVDAAEGPAPVRPASPPSQETRGMAGNNNSSSSGGGGQKITIDHVMAQLPPKAECDGFLTFYFQQVYMIPPTLHAGQFQRAYERFWRNPDETSLLWISILFALLSTSLMQQQTVRAAAVGGQDTATAPSDRIAAFSLMAYRCLEAGDYLAGNTYSVEATLLYGMHLVLQKRDAEPSCWHILSTAVRLAQRMGYHRDASQLDRGAGAGTDRAPPPPAALSAFEAEMRRRTWYTLEYFDVVYSFQLGVPPIIQPADVDTRLPANLRDDEFDELEDDHRLQQKLDARAARHLSSPSSSSLLDFTPILGFIYYSRQVQLLRRVVQQTLAVNPAPTYGDVRLLDADLRSLHADVPPSLRYRPVRESGFADPPDVIMRRLVCEVMYLKSLCVLHRRYLLRGWTANAEVSGVYGASRRTCCEAALGLLDLQAEFDEHSSEPGSRLYERRYILTNTGYHDFLLAAMCLCLDLTAAVKEGHTEKDRKIAALRRARAIWAKLGSSQKNAIHATQVLDKILASIAQADGAARFAGAHRANDLATTTITTSSSSSSSSSSPTHDKYVNNSSNSGPYSQLWAFGWMDDLEKVRGRASADMNGVLAEVDWNRIDSFLLHRKHTTGSRREAGPSASEAAKDLREGWPILNYNDNPVAPTHPSPPPPPSPARSSSGVTTATGAEGGGRRDGRGSEGGERGGDSSGYRNWSSAGITLAGFGPPSTGSTFL